LRYGNRERCLKTAKERERTFRRRQKGNYNQLTKSTYDGYLGSKLSGRKAGIGEDRMEMKSGREAREKHIGRKPHITYTSLKQRQKQNTKSTHSLGSSILELLQPGRTEPG